MFITAHYENTPIQIYWKFHHQKKWKFSDKNSDIFHISAQNIDCGYSLCISVLRVASGPRVKLAGCKSALNPKVVYSTDRSKVVVPVLVLLFIALWFILRGDLF